MELIIGQGRYSKEYCPVCGSLLLVNGKCERIHKKLNPRRGKFSGKSKSEFAFNNYK